MFRDKSNRRLNYFEYEKELGRKTLIPMLENFGASLQSAAILDLGCGEGGCLAAISEKFPDTTCFGIDISSRQIMLAQKHAPRVSFVVGDVLTLALNKKFDIILLRDVVEHIPNVKEVLRNAARILQMGGVIFVSFPPYLSPYGGHQQNNSAIIAKLPYIHYLPDAMYFKIANPFWMKMYKDLRQNRLTIKKMNRIIEDSNLRILKHDLYLLRPVFRYRYGLPTIKMHMLGKIPLIREFMATGAFYFLTQRG